MAEFTSHAPGTFSWVELATTDPKGGVAFYRTLFDWDVVEHDWGRTASTRSSRGAAA
jgi:predicted enzyme related to lactoylglutathione lyase